MLTKTWMPSALILSAAIPLSGTWGEGRWERYAHIRMEKASSACSLYAGLGYICHCRNCNELNLKPSLSLCYLITMLRRKKERGGRKFTAVDSPIIAALNLHTCSNAKTWFIKERLFSLSPRRQCEYFSKPAEWTVSGLSAPTEPQTTTHTTHKLPSMC